MKANVSAKSSDARGEICSACYYVERTLETGVGNVICADGAATFLLSGISDSNSTYPNVIDFETLSIQSELMKSGSSKGTGRCECPGVSRSNIQLDHG